MKKKFVSVVLMVSISAVHLPAQALDGLGLTVGTGPDADMMSLQLIWDWDKKWPTQKAWEFVGYWQLDLSVWEGTGPPPERRLYAVGIAPIVRYQQKLNGRYGFFVEGGIGVYEFSGTQLHAGKRIGTSFEFGDHVGLGLRFGSSGQHDISYRFQHYSNGGISRDNSGVNFHQIRLKIGM
jgi:lipid A 3-O-deacylase